MTNEVLVLDWAEALIHAGALDLSVVAEKHSHEPSLTALRNAKALLLRLLADEKARLA